jgi:hypothetical protein
MDNGSTDDKLREAFRQMAPPVDAASFHRDLKAKLSPRGDERWPLDASADGLTDGRKRPPATRRRSGLRVAVYASAAVVLVAAIAIGSREAIQYFGKEQPILVITDETAGISAASAGQTEDEAAMLSGLEPFVGTMVAISLGEEKSVWKIIASDPRVSGTLTLTNKPTATREVARLLSSSGVLANDKGTWVADEANGVNIPLADGHEHTLAFAVFQGTGEYQGLTLYEQNHTDNDVFFIDSSVKPPSADGAMAITGWIQKAE